MRGDHCIALRLRFRNQVPRLKVAVSRFKIPTGIVGGMSCSREGEVWKKRAVNSESYQGQEEPVLTSVDSDALALEIKFFSKDFSKETVHLLFVSWPLESMFLSLAIRVSEHPILATSVYLIAVGVVLHTSVPQLFLFF